MKPYTLTIVPDQQLAVMQSAALYGPIGTALYTTYGLDPLWPVSQVRANLPTWCWLSDKPRKAARS